MRWRAGRFPPRGAGTGEGRRLRETATLRSIAAALGLTPAAVSMALRNLPGVSAETRRRVAAEAARQGYRPNRLIASRMAKVRGSAADRGYSLPSVAYLSGYTEASFRTNPFLRAERKGVRDQAKALGFPLRCVYGAGVVRGWDEIAEELEQRRVLGVVLGDFRAVHPEVRLDWERFCLVAIGYSARRPPMHTVCEENLRRTLAALRRIEATGARRIGFLVSTINEQCFSHTVTAAYLAWRAGRPRAEQVPILRWEGVWADAARFQAWRRRHKVDFFFTGLPKTIFQNLLSEREQERTLCLSRLQSGLEKEEDIALSKPDYEVGQAAMRLLAEFMYRHETGLPPRAFEIEVVAPPRPRGGVLPALRRRKASSPEVTFRDIAASLDLSPSTVSLAMRGDPRVAPPTREKVREAARRLGYRQNPLLNAWAADFHEAHRHRDVLFAHISGFPPSAFQTRPRFAAIRQCLRARLQAMRATLDFFHLDGETLGTDRLAAILHARNAHAVLWGPFPEDMPPPPMVWPKGVSVIGLGRSPATRGLDRVIHSRYRGMRTLMMNLLAAGYQRPGLAGGGPADDVDPHGWAPAFLQMTESVRPRAKTAWLPLERPDPARLRTWLSRYRPDVVLSPFPDLGVHCRQTAFVALEPDPARLPPDTAALLYPGAAITDRAVDLLVSHMDMNLFGAPAAPHDTLLAGEFRPGSSCPRLDPSPAINRQAAT